MNDYPNYESCEMCGATVLYGFSLCNECDDKVLSFDEEAEKYIVKNGEIIDTTKHQF